MLPAVMVASPDTVALRCPKCRATLAVADKQEGDSALHICKFCETVVIHREGEWKVAGRQQKTDQEVDWLHALCCRLCGGSLSKEAAKEPGKAKCSYCGHLALLRPGVVTILRLLFRDPKLVPPALRRRVFFSLAIVMATIAMTAFMVVQESGPRIANFTVDGSKVEVGDVVYDEVVDLPGFSTTLELRRDSRNRKNAPGLDAVFLHLSSGSCFATGAHRQGHYSGQSKVEIPRGKTRAFVQVKSKGTETGKSRPGREPRYYVASSHALSLGYLILALNIVFWLGIAVIKFGVDFQSTKRRAARVTQALSLLFVAWWFCITVLQINPLGPREFSPNDVAAESRHGETCRSLLAK